MHDVSCVGNNCGFKMLTRNSDPKDNFLNLLGIGIGSDRGMLFVVYSDPVKTAVFFSNAESSEHETGPKKGGDT